jgi:hypothetical protein
MTIDGWDPVEQRAILERMKETWLASSSRTIDILIAGIECLGGDEHPLIIEERLRAFLPSSVRPGPPSATQPTELLSGAGGAGGADV